MGNGPRTWQELRQSRGWPPRTKSFGPLVFNIDERRFYGFRWRWHHGLLGLQLIAVGLALCWHDRKDWQRWLPRPMERLERSDGLAIKR